MPIEFIQESQPAGSSSDTLFRLLMKYDGTGRRISKTVMHKVAGAADWDTAQVTHYTGIGTEIRENYAGPAKQTKVVVNMPVFFRVTLTRLKPRSYIEKDILRLSNGGAILPKQSFGASRQGLGRYGIEDATQLADDNASQKFEWYLKNHLGSTMLVYGTQADANPAHSDIGTPLAAYDYRAFGEMVELTPPPTGKVTENFTGKEHDDEIALNYFGARYLDPMLGMWISVDPKRQFASPYLYAGNGMNPVNAIDPDGNETTINLDENNKVLNMTYTPNDNATVMFYKPGVEPFTAAEPPQGSFFFTQDLHGVIFDFNMERNASDMLEDAYMLYPVVDVPEWGTGGTYDFKYTYYQKKGESEYTIGVLNGTAMTARDAGNAIWGGWFRNMYVPSRGGMKLVADWVANRNPKNEGRGEDPGSAVMQRWGYDNFNPTEHIGFGTFLIKALTSPR